MRICLVSTVFMSILLAACSRQQAKSPHKQYPVTGKIVSINLQDKTAAVDASAIPNYMGAMTMDYPIASASELQALKVGEQITATIDVADDGSYSLSNIRQRK